MKKFIKSLALIAVAAFGFASCEDVPAPYTLPTVGGSAEEIVVEPKGDGTAANPFNVKGLTEWIAANEATAKGKEVYIEGIVSSIKSLDVSKYDRAQYYINDTESTSGQFYVYNGYYLNGAKFTSNDQLKVGDKVLIKGTIDQYDGAFQIGQNSQILKLNEEGDGAGAGDGDVIEITSAKAAELALALEDKTESAETYAVTGYITNTDGKISKDQQTFWMADTKDGGKVFEAFWANIPDPTKALTVGTKVKITGKLKRFGSTPEMQNAKVEVLEAGEGGDDNGDQGETGEPKGTGTQADPYNVAAALAYINTLSKDDAPKDLVYTKGLVKEVVKMGTSGSIQFKMQDKDVANELLVFYCDNLGKTPFTAATDLKAGDEVIVCGTVKNYNGNTPEYNPGAYLVSLNGKTEAEGGDKGDEGDKGEGDQNTGDGMTINDLPSDITTNAYGTQLADDESTWLTWTWNGIEFAGARICKANAIDGTIQFQGDDANTAKQGFLFNKTAWTKNISKITLVLKVKESTTGTTYDPSYSLYAGSTAHPTESAITPTSSMTTADGIRTYTQVFDLSSANAKYFTIHNNKKGALYVAKIIVE